MSDIVKRLQDPPFGTDTSERLLMKSAADHIEALEAALAKADELADILETKGLVEGLDYRTGPALDVYLEARKKLQ